MPSEKSSPVGQKKTAKKSHGGWWFLFIVIVLYSLIGFFNTDFISASLKHFQALIISITPILALVFIIIWLLNLSQGMQDKLAKLADKNSGIKGWLLAVLGGILSHGPVYAWYPLLQKLENQGARPALIACFLYARSIKIPYLPLMVHYFGLSYTVLLTVYTAIFSILHGWLLEKITKRTLTVQK